MSNLEIKGEIIPQELTDTVIGSVVSIFNTILGSEPKFDGDDSDKKIGDGVVGIISFVGDVTWLLMLAIPRKSAEAISLQFTGFEVDYESPEMGDVVGELANVLAGDIVARFARQNTKIGMSLPTIMRGHDVEPLLPRGIPSAKLHFSLPQGELMLKVAGAKKGESLGRKPGT